MPVPTIPTKRDLSVVNGGTEVYEDTAPPAIAVGNICAAPGFANLRVTDIRIVSEGAFQTKVVTTVTYAPATSLAGIGGKGPKPNTNESARPWDQPPEISTDFQEIEEESEKDALGQVYRNSNGEIPVIKPTRPFFLPVINIRRAVNITVNAAATRANNYNGRVNSDAFTVAGWSVSIGGALLRYRSSQAWDKDDDYIIEDIQITINDAGWSQLLADKGTMYDGKKKLVIRGANFAPLGGGAGGAQTGASRFRSEFRLNGNGHPLLFEDPNGGGGLAAQGVANIAVGAGGNDTTIAESSATGVFLKYAKFKTAAFAGLNLP